MFYIFPVKAILYGPEKKTKKKKKKKKQKQFVTELIIRNFQGTGKQWYDIYKK